MIHTRHACVYVCVSCAFPYLPTNKQHPNSTTGPILPVLGVGSVEEALSIIRRKPNPLALYVFAHDKYVHGDGGWGRVLMFGWRDKGRGRS